MNRSDILIDANEIKYNMKPRIIKPHGSIL